MRIPNLVLGLLLLLLTVDCAPLVVEPSASVSATPVPAVVAPSETEDTDGAPPLAADAPPATVELSLSAAPPATLELPGEGLSLGQLPPLTAEGAMDQVVERAPLPAEARIVVRTLRPTMTVEPDGAGHWIVTTGVMGQWRVDEQSWQVEPHDGTAQLWELQSRLDLR